MSETSDDRVKTDRQMWLCTHNTDKRNSQCLECSDCKREKRALVHFKCSSGSLSVEEFIIMALFLRNRHITGIKLFPRPQQQDKQFASMVTSFFIVSSF